ncbi:MAG: hypothetical protein GXP25_25060 [Planctomycetes bacterium]|nr:hypothetical protein [Planctomycetota bacterium]
MRCKCRLIGLALVFFCGCMPRESKAPEEPGRVCVKGFEGEKIRLLYCGEDVETPELIRQTADAGFNVMEKLHWKMWEPERAKNVEEAIRLAKPAGLKVLVGVWLPTGISDPAFAEKRPFGFYNAARPKKGCLAPDIYDGAWWRQQIIPALLKYVERSREGTVIGISLDLEIYQGRPVPGIYTDVCYCDPCVKEFCEQAGLKFEPVELKDRRSWFAEKEMLRRFRDFQKARLAKYVEELRRRTDAINPYFVYMLLPYRTGGNILNLALAKRLGTAKAPVIIATEATYGIPKEATPEQALILTDDTIRNIHRYEAARGHQHTVLLPGISLTAPNTPQKNARRIVTFGRREAGYWIWGRRLLFSEYWLKKMLAPADEFWRWFKVGNDCIMDRAAPPKEILPVSMPKYELGTNIVPAPGFEEGSAEKAWGGFPKGVTIATTERHSGTRSLRLETDSVPRLARLYWRTGGEIRKFPIKPNTLYRISMWARTTKFTGGWSPYCGVLIYDKDGKQIAKASVSSPRYERAWELREQTFLSPPKAVSAAFHISVLGKGNCSYVDDVALREIVVGKKP